MTNRSKQNSNRVKQALRNAEKMNTQIGKFRPPEVKQRFTKKNGETLVNTYKSGKLLESIQSNKNDLKFPSHRYTFNRNNSRKLNDLFLRGADEKKLRIAPKKQHYTHSGVGKDGGETLFHGRQRIPFRDDQGNRNERFYRGTVRRAGILGLWPESLRRYK